MVKVTFVGYAGNKLEIRNAEDRADAVRQLTEYPGAGSAILESARGVESIARGEAFVSVDGNRRERRPVWKDLRPSYNANKVRRAASWYGAAVLAR